MASFQKRNPSSVLEMPAFAARSASSFCVNYFTVTNCEMEIRREIVTISHGSTRAVCAKKAVVSSKGLQPCELLFYGFPLRPIWIPEKNFSLFEKIFPRHPRTLESSFSAQEIRGPVLWTATFPWSKTRKSRWSFTCTRAQKPCRRKRACTANLWHTSCSTGSGFIALLPFSTLWIAAHAAFNLQELS
jgi:hypothetical protein